VSSSVSKEGVDGWDKVPSFDAGEAPRRSTLSLDPMTDFAIQWSQYRRLRNLTFVPLLACFAFVILIGLGFDEKVHPVLWNLAAAADVVCFLMFCFNGLKLSRFRCPRCGEYFSRGEKTHRKREAVTSCRHCGLNLYGEV
jgi:predicted RNA-binding Zn-ribbon protein involved in translation (DUF1610 family)